MCAEHPKSALFVSSSNVAFVLHHRPRDHPATHRCPILSYSRPVTAAAMQQAALQSHSHLMDVIEMLLLSRSSDMLVFLHSTYSQAAYSLAGVTHPS